MNSNTCKRRKDSFWEGHQQQVAFSTWADVSLFESWIEKELQKFMPFDYLL